MANATLTQEISLKWTLEDVLTVRPDLTEEQASLVLEETLRRHDASLGVNWDTLAEHARGLFGPEA